MQSFVVISLLLAFSPGINSVTWNYDSQGPDVWSDNYPLCVGQVQSPIDIRTACTTYRSYNPFNFSSAYNQTQNLTLTNDGHTIGGKRNGDGLSPLVLTGGGLDGAYEFLDLHLHWGENYKSGSEHQVNGKKYAGEIHFVHRQLTTGKLAVLGMFMQSTPSGSTNRTLASRGDKDLLTTKYDTSNEWMRYFATAVNLQAQDNSADVRLNLASLMTDNLNDFWRYGGSLTTPPCTEGITWTVFKTPITFSDSELNSFRQLLFKKTYRNPQPLYSRIVYRSFPTNIFSLIPDYNYCPTNANTANQFLQWNSFLIIFFCLLLI